MLSSIIGFLIALFVVVIAHEFGHFIVARKNGVKVHSFSIGFGPELWGRTDKYGTRWKLCPILLGGYVSMEGQSDTPVQPEKKAVKKLTAKQKQSFLYKGPWAKSAIIFAGPFFNYILAFLIMFFIFWGLGEKQVKPYVGKVTEGSVAAKMGLLAGDLIIGVNDNYVEDFSEIPGLLKESEEVKILYIRDGEGKKAIAQFPEGTARRLGITASAQEIIYKENSMFRAMARSGVMLYEVSRDTTVALGEMIMGRRSVQELGGLIKIADMSGEALDAGKSFSEKVISLSLLIALLSISIGLINLFPLPPLDGGQLVFYIYEGIFKKEVPQKIQNALFTIGFVMIILLMIVANGNDIISLIKK